MIKLFSAALQLVIFIIFLTSCSKEESTTHSQLVDSTKTLFTELNQAQTGIHFQNTLAEGPNTNILVYEYFYNGGGVATGDFNGDGMADIYFVSNMGTNQLYLNKGNLEFTEIGALSGAQGRNGPWKTGVTIVDIDGDNKLDIYLCYSGALPDPKRANQLFINQGNNADGIPTFIDKANEYGLASTAYSNQGYFFDYDKDGDLDMILLNHNPKSLPVLNEVQTKEFLKHDDPNIGSRLFKQVTTGHFEDVTQKAGISGSALSYGLGVGISDLNNDGWLDFYISNDYNVPDYLYINNHNGTFTDQLKSSVGHNSQFSMGNDVGDINNDGWTDVLTLDMLPEDNHRQKLLLAPDNYGKFELNLRSGFHYQYMRNMLQLNNGNGTFSEVGQLAGISNTDWSWAALLADYNNDGWKDLFISNGYFRDYTNLDFIKYMNEVVELKGRLRREDVLEIIKHMPASNVVNYIYSNNKGIRFTDQTKAWGLDKPSNSAGSAYADLDNDGDLDIISNNVNQVAFIYRNDQSLKSSNHFIQCKLLGEGLNTLGVGARITLTSKSGTQTQEQMPTRGYLSSVSPILHFGLGDDEIIDTVSILWESNKQEIIVNVKSDQLLSFEERNAIPFNRKKLTLAPLFMEVKSPIQRTPVSSEINDFNRQPQLPYQFSFTGSVLKKADVNNDGKEDVYVSGAYNEAGSLFVQTSSGGFSKRSVADFEKDKIFVDQDAVFFDSDNDGDLDLYVASGGYHSFEPNDDQLQDRIYINDGKGNFKKNENALPEIYDSKGCVSVLDINGDGFKDLFVGGRLIPGRYPESPTSYLLINDGKGNFADQTKVIAPDLQRLGMITDAVSLDINGDKIDDLIVVGEWLPISVWINENGKLINRTAEYFDKEYIGFWNTIEVADFNNDNKPDLLVGNFGLNSQLHASDERPVELFYSDFDKNGSVDPILCCFIQNKSFPYLTRDELLEQQGRFRSKYNSYRSFSDVTINELLTPQEFQSAKRLFVNHLSTSLFLSTSDKKYKLRELPDEAQFSPIFSITTMDYNNDNNLDILLAGNIEHMKIKMGKLDANYGIVLKGNGKGGFQYINQKQSGLNVKGDVRDVLKINDYLIFGTVQNPIKAYKMPDK